MLALAVEDQILPKSDSLFSKEEHKQRFIDYKAYEKKKNELNFWDDLDLSYEAYKKFENYSGRYRQVIVDEIQDFIKGIKDKSLYPNNIDDDIKILKILERIENSHEGFKKS